METNLVTLFTRIDAMLFRLGICTMKKWVKKNEINKEKEELETEDVVRTYEELDRCWLLARMKLVSA